MEKTKSSEEGEKIMAKSNVDVHQLAKDVKVELNLLRDEVLKYEVDAQLARKEVVAVSHKIKTLEDVNAIKEVEERKKKLEVIVKKVEKDLEWKSKILLQKDAKSKKIVEESRNKRNEDRRKLEEAAGKKAFLKAKKDAEKARSEARKRALKMIKKPQKEIPIFQKMSKKELEDYGRTIGIELDRRHNKKRLIKTLESFKR